MSNILILGNGFIGSKINQKLTQSLDKSHTVQIISQSDMDYTNVCNLLSDDIMAPDIIINACGYTGKPNVDACEDNRSECWRLNTVFPVNLHEFCKATGVLLIHVSSGCIYNGYDKVYTEEDESNFGLYDDVSSFYSKSKHAAEILMDTSSSLVLFRIRIPFTCDSTSRNYLNKLLGYDNIISMDNSITCVEEFTSMIYKMIESGDIYNIPAGIYNAVNPEPVTASTITDILVDHGLHNDNWSIVELSALDIKANRSNCILSDDKLSSIGYRFDPTLESLINTIKKLSTDVQLRKKYSKKEGSQTS